MRLWNLHWSFDRKGHLFDAEKNTCQIWQILLASIHITESKRKKKYTQFTYHLLFHCKLHCPVMFWQIFFSKLLRKLTNKTTTNNKKKGERQRMCKTRILPFICESHTIRPWNSNCTCQGRRNLWKSEGISVPWLR